MDRVVIYGGSGGIGSATAKALRARGFPLHLVGRDTERLERLAGDLGQTGFTAGDVTDPTLFARVAEEAGETLGGLVYAVGSITLKSLARLAADEVAADFRLNALGAFLALQAHASALKAGEEGAGVVLFSTVATSQGFPNHACVAMAKGAVEGLALSLAAELAPHVRVNVVAPSLTRTPLAESITRNATLASGIAGMHALQRLGEAEDVAALASFLVSGEAAYVTGQVIGVDGGRSRLRTKG